MRKRTSHSTSRGGDDPAAKIIGSLLGTLLGLAALAFFFYYGMLSCVGAL